MSTPYSPSATGPSVILRDQRDGIAAVLSEHEGVDVNIPLGRTASGTVATVVPDNGGGISPAVQVAVPVAVRARIARARRASLRRLASASSCLRPVPAASHKVQGGHGVGLRRPSNAEVDTVRCNASSVPELFGYDERSVMPRDPRLQDALAGARRRLRGRGPRRLPPPPDVARPRFQTGPPRRRCYSHALLRT